MNDIRNLVRGTLPIQGAPGPIGIILSYIETEDEWIECLSKRIGCRIKRHRWDPHLYLVQKSKEKQLMAALAAVVPNSKLSDDCEYIHGKDAIPIRLNARAAVERKESLRDKYIATVPIPSIYVSIMPPDPQRHSEDDVYIDKADFNVFVLSADRKWVFDRSLYHNI